MAFLYYCLRFVVMFICRGIYRSLFFSSILTLSFTVFAGEDTVDQEALEKTVKLMQNQAQRQEVINSSKDAKKADDMAKGLVGDGEDLQKMYKLAGSLFKNVANKDKDDLSSMIESMQKAQQDPEAFYKNMTPEQKAMVRELGKSAELRKKQAEQQHRP